MSTIMYARVTDDGTAMGETSYCARHFDPSHRDAGNQEARTAGDSSNPRWFDVTGNDYLRCNDCGIDTNGKVEE